MADNVTLDAGSGGDTIATEDIAGVEYQKVKLIDGTATSTTAIPLSGDLTNGLDVDVTRVGGTVSIQEASALDVSAATVTVDLGANNDVINAGTFAVQEDGAALTALQLIDDAVYTDDDDWTDTTSKHLLVGGVYQSTEQTITDGDVGPLEVDSNGRLKVSIEVDNAGIGGGTQYAEDAVHSTGDTGTVALAVRNDTLAALAGTDGDYAVLQVDADGALYCTISSIAGAQVDDAAFTPGTDSVSMIGCSFDDTMPDSVDEGDGGAVRMSARREMYVQLRDAAGNERGLNIDANNDIGVTNAGLTELAAAINSSQLDINIASDSVGIGGGTQYTEDAAAAANPVGNAQILVRTDTPATQTTTDGDNVAQRGTNYGAAYVQVVDSSGNYIDTFGGSGGTAAADDADFTAGTTQGTPAMGVYESVPTSVTDGDLGTVGITVNRALKVELNDALTPNGDSMVDDTNDALQVNVVTGALAAVGGDAENAAASQNPIQVAGRYDATPRTLDDGDVGAVALDPDGAVHVSDGGNTLTVDGTVTANLSATDNAVLDTIDAVLDTINAKLVTGTVIGDVNLGATDNAVLDAIAASVADRQVLVGATGTTTYYDSDLDETAIGVDAGAVNIYSIQAFNTTAAPLFLQLFNIASGSVTVGTTAPTNQYVIPGNADSDGAGFSITFGVPKSYGTAFTVACTTDSEGSAAPGTGACIVNIEYAT